MSKRISLLGVVCFTIVLVPGWPGVASIRAAGQAPAPQQSGMSGMQMPDMMKMHEKMMADMKTEQVKLDNFVTKMNAATGTAKVAVMADLLTEMVHEHQMMADRMGAMHQQMMKMGK